VTKVPIDKPDIEKSIELIKQSTVDHEFRTTIARNILSKEDVVNIAKMLQVRSCTSCNVAYQQKY